MRNTLRLEKDDKTEFKREIKKKTNERSEP